MMTPKSGPPTTVTPKGASIAVSPPGTAPVAGGLEVPGALDAGQLQDDAESLQAIEKGFASAGPFTMEKFDKAIATSTEWRKLLGLADRALDEYPERFDDAARARLRSLSYAASLAPSHGPQIAGSGEFAQPADAPQPLLTLRLSPARPEVRVPTLAALLAGGGGVIHPSEGSIVFGDALRDIAAAWYASDKDAELPDEKREQRQRVRMARDVGRALALPERTVLSMFGEKPVTLPAYKMRELAAHWKVDPVLLAVPWAADLPWSKEEGWRTIQPLFASSDPALEEEAALARGQFLMELAVRLSRAGVKSFSVRSDFTMRKAVMFASICMSAGIHPSIAIPVAAGGAAHTPGFAETFEKAIKAFTKLGHEGDVALAYLLKAAVVERRGDLPRAISLLGEGRNFLPTQRPPDDSGNVRDHLAPFFDYYLETEERLWMQTNGLIEDLKTMRQSGAMGERKTKGLKGMLELTAARMRVFMPVLKAKDKDNELLKAVQKEGLLPVVLDSVWAALDPKRKKSDISPAAFRLAFRVAAAAAGVDVSAFNGGGTVVLGGMWMRQEPPVSEAEAEFPLRNVEAVEAEEKRIAEEQRRVDKLEEEARYAARRRAEEEEARARGAKQPLG